MSPCGADQTAGPQAGVLWITGLSGAGKSTLAALAAARLRDRGRAVALLDGDELREILGAADVCPSNHGREARIALAMRYARLCRLLAEQGVLVVIATISLFHEVHAWNRANLPGYFEAYLKVPVEELRRRDPKGLYRRYDCGELDQVAGLDLTVDEPRDPDWAPAFTPGRPAETLADELLERFWRRDP